ncbi:MAG: hypothetical protein OJF52_002130 [Nitrospira sp.]|jgi:hypothetical protein|nr:MAG: hypothetical protein OJF52_002130 [Nitrospira sp.]
MALKRSMTKLQRITWSGLVAFFFSFLIQTLPASAEFYFGKVRKIDAESRLMVLETTEGRTKEFTVPSPELLADVTEGANIFVEASQNQAKRIRLLEALPVAPSSPASRSEAGGTKESQPVSKTSTKGSDGPG